MLENYELLPSGVIKQSEIFRDTFHFEEKDPSYYVRYYESIKEKSLQNAYLRFSYMLGALGKTPKSIVDIGYGNGDFLKVAADSKIESVSGFDVVHEFELPERVNLISDFSYVLNNYFEVITFFDALEHFDNLDFISNLNCDYVYVSLPWCHNFSDEWFKNWKHRKPNEHLFHFNLESITNLFKENGFELICSSDVEDLIRTPVDENSNILSCIFKKIK